MQFIVRKLWDLPDHEHTAEDDYRRRRLLRREFLRSTGVAAASSALLPLAGCARPTDQEIADAGRVEIAPANDEVYPAQRNPSFKYGRPETGVRAAAEYTNFYEFAFSKAVYKYVSKFEPSPWTLNVDGCAPRREFDT